MAATTAAVIGIATTLGTTAMSFNEMAKQNDLAAKAQDDATKAMEEAKRQLSINPFAGISLPTQAYDMQTNAVLAEGAQATQAAKESERGAAATAGRIAAQTNVAESQIAAKEAQDLYALQTQTANAQRDINKSLASVDLAEVEGAQKAQAQAQNAANMYQTQAIQGIASAATQAAQAMPLFSSTAASRQYGKFGDTYADMVKNNKVPSSLMGADGKPLSQEAAFLKVAGVPQADMAKITQQNGTLNPDVIAGYASGNYSAKQLEGFTKSLPTFSLPSQTNTMAVAPTAPTAPVPTGFPAAVPTAPLVGPQALPNTGTPVNLSTPSNYNNWDAWSQFGG